MKVLSASDDFVELEHAPAEHTAGNVRLLARVRAGRFSGEVEIWVEQTTWFAFAQHLTILEETRQGEARLESMSPGELSLVFRSLGRTGDVGVEGMIGTQAFDGEVALRFSVFAFDPSQLVALARAARSLSEAAGCLRTAQHPPPVRSTPSTSTPRRCGKASGPGSTSPASAW